MVYGAGLENQRACQSAPWVRIPLSPQIMPMAESIGSFFDGILIGVMEPF